MWNASKALVERAHPDNSEPCGESLVHQVEVVRGAGLEVGIPVEDRAVLLIHDSPGDQVPVPWPGKPSPPGGAKVALPVRPKREVGGRREVEGRHRIGRRDVLSRREVVLEIAGIPLVREEGLESRVVISHVLEAEGALADGAPTIGEVGHLEPRGVVRNVLTQELPPELDAADASREGEGEGEANVTRQVLVLLQAVVPP